MAWVTIANPNNLSKRNKTRRVNMSQMANAVTGSYDNVNMLHQVYRGRMDRIQRMVLFDWMDQDSDVQRALDLLAEHVVPKDRTTKLRFAIDYDTNKLTDEENTVITENLKYWFKLNDFDKRILRDIRSVLKYGDWFYWRNPKTFELYSIHPKLIQGAIVNTEKLEVLAWIIRGFKFNTEDMELINTNSTYQSLQAVFAQSNSAIDTKIVPANHIIHLSLSEGKFAGAAADDAPTNAYSSRWPFGESLLEGMYKTFKQRELLEDAFLIHRIQRAPTRRVWYIDTGKVRPDKAKWIINDFRNEINERRVPEFFGAQGKTVDSTYNPQSQLEDYYIPVSDTGRGSKVENLEGQPWNDIPELKYMATKMYRALRIPFSMLLGSGSGSEETGNIFSDGKTGTAYMPEIEFSKFCDKLQTIIYGPLDWEFKLFLKAVGVPYNAADFTLIFNPPTNYEDYLQNMRDQDNIAVWSQIKAEPWISQRYALIRYLGWTEADLATNERMKAEENSPMLAPAMGGGGGGMPGLGAGTGMMGQLPMPTDQMNQGMDPLQPGQIPAGGTGATFGAGTTGSAGAPGGLTASRRISPMAASKKLFEDQIELSDIQPAKKKTADIGTYTSKTQDDQTFMQKDPVKGSIPITLKMIRDLRRAHLRQKIEYQKRLKIISKIYRNPTDASGGAMPV